MKKFERFLTKMKALALDDPMMRKWLYGTTKLLRERDLRIIRLCKYPDMIPDELLIAYAEVLADILEREQKLNSFIVSSNNAMDSVNTIARRILTSNNNCHISTLAERIRNAISYETN